MPNNLKITLYDLFGYLLPGVPGLLGVITLFWTLYRASNGINILMQHGTGAWVCAGLIAYFFGHALEALTQIVYGDYWESIITRADIPAPQKRRLRRLFNADWWLPALWPGSTNLYREQVRQARRSAARAYRIEAERVSPDWLFTHCGLAIAKDGIEGNREIFTYREGFYKSSSLSVLFLAVSLVIAAVGKWREHGPALLVVALASFALSLLFIKRAKYIREKRSADTLALFLRLTEDVPLESRGTLGAGAGK